MAQRFGGRHSPTDIPRSGGTERGAAGPAAPDWSDRRRTRAGGRVNLLFVAPAPLLLGAIASDATGLALNVAAFALLMAAAWMTREGIVAEEHFDARRNARRPALPRKMLGSLLTGCGLAVAGMQTGAVAPPVIFAILGAGLHFLSFGPDPLRDKVADGVDGFQAGRVARVVDEAQRHLDEIVSAVAATGDRPLVRRVGSFVNTVRRMVRSVEDDPRDLSAARRYLGVYLLGARDATTRYTDLHRRRPDDAGRADYVALLDDMEQGFAARTERMLLDDRTDLDIEIGVLRDRLAREGIAQSGRDAAP